MANNEKKVVRSAAEKALLANMKKAYDGNDAAALKQVRDAIVAAKNVIADFNKLADALEATRAENDPLRKAAERVALRQTGAGRPSKGEKERVAEIFG